MSDFNEAKRLLDQLLLVLWKGCEHADATLEGLNDRLNRLAATGILKDTVVLGPCVLARPYSVGFSPSSGQVIQAALAFPGGFGAIYWDSEEMRDVHEIDLNSRAFRDITPYEECEVAIRCLIAPHANDLLRMILGLMKV